MGLDSHDTHITNAREKALDFLTAETTQLPRRLEEGFSISTPGDIGASAWVEQCWDKSLKTLEKYLWLLVGTTTADPVRCHFLNLMLAEAKFQSEFRERLRRMIRI